jgi:hypothetical protein
MTNSERLGHILVAIPIAHVLGSAFYLWSYCLGFGANIVVYASASDLLSVSINDMVRVYATSLAIPVVITASRLASRYPYAVDMANALPVDQQADAHATNRTMRKSINWVAIVSFLILGGLVLRDVIIGNQFPYTLLLIALQIPAVVLWMGVCERRGFSNMTYEVGTIFGGFVLALFCVGASRGQSDRFIYYRSALTSHTTCGKAAVLRQISGKYLSILPNNSRALISEDCKVIFRVPAPKGPPLYAEPEKTVVPTLKTPAKGVMPAHDNQGLAKPPAA